MARKNSLNSLETDIERRIQSSQDVAFLRREFANLSGSSQVTRALARIVAKGMLLRLEPGIFGRAASDPSTGKTVLAAEHGDVAHQAMLKLRTLDEATIPRSPSALRGRPLSPEG